MTLMSIVVKGGWTMVAIGIAFFVGLYFVIERFIYFRRSKSPADELLKKANAWVKEGDLKIAVKEIKVYDSPITRIIIKGLLSRNVDAMEAQASEELARLESGMGVISSVSAVAPMLGFFGTVLGMIKAFMQIEILGGGVNPSRLAGGIWEALVTTAAGLAVGIIFLILYNLLTDRLNSFVNDMNRVKAEISSTMGI
ncbi:MotA/TolQ/ExbB proton channel family protein [candidate division WOR-3 bacterium]|nr:MotA/TolQ/ExbB proton channel family protein [candidate division WOR-3 bacterium]